MTHKEYIDKIQELENQLSKVTDEYVDSNKIYNIGDYLKISFNVPYLNNKKIVRYCKIINIYPEMYRGFMDNKSWPKGELVYFARYVFKDEFNFIHPGDVCYLGPLSHYNNTCGYKDIDWKTVKIEVIDESQLLGELRK